ncbi:MAG: peptide-N-glycosidase F-related protein [Polyangiaceae bacterium]
MDMRILLRGRGLSVGLVLASGAWGCGGSHPGAAPADGGDDGTLVEAGGEGGSTDGGAESAALNGTPGTFNVFDAIPQFGIYTSTDPANYTPPGGVLMWSHGTVFVTQLGADQQAQIGSDLAARITYIAQCDNYDRLGGIFFIVEPKGQAPQPTDPRTEIVRFITPFSDYARGPNATHVYPDADISPYAQVLADTSHDVWVGIAGGSNPYSGDPCVARDAGGADYQAIGFKYSLDFVSTQQLTLGPSVVLTAVSDVSESATPIDGGFDAPDAALTGNVTVIVSGHGSGAGGDEYENTKDTVTLNGAQVGTFDTMIDCSGYAKYSPDGNPGIFQGNTTSNPRNWCPGALVPSHTFPATLNPGTNTVSLGIVQAAVPSGSYYPTTINFTSP